MSNNDGTSSEDLVLLDECQREFTESYLALILRILKKFPDCTYSNAESKIFQGLEIPETNLELKYSSTAIKHEDIWNDIPETSPPSSSLPSSSSSSSSTEIDKDNVVMNKIEEIRRSKSLRYRDAIRAIRLQMLIDHVSSQSQEMMSQVKLMQTLTRKLNHLYEMTPPPPKPAIMNDISTLDMNNKIINNGIDNKGARISVVVSTCKSDLMSSSTINISEEMIMNCATISGNHNNNNAIMAGDINLHQNLLQEKDIIPMHDVSNLLQTRLDKDKDKDKDQDQSQELSSYENRSCSNGPYTKNTSHSNVSGDKLTTMGHNIGISNTNNSPGSMRPWKNNNKKVIRKHSKHMIRSNYISGSAASVNKSSSKDRELDRNLKRKRKYMEEMDNYSGYEPNDYEWEYSDHNEPNTECNNETKSSEWEEREKEREDGVYGAPPTKKYRRVVSKRPTLGPQYAVDMFQLQQYRSLQDDHKRNHSNQE